jgi:hypothetical protein
VMDDGTSSDGYVFRGVKGGPLATVTYRRAWDRARKAAFDAAEYASPLARRPYDPRHACLSTWLNGGVARPDRRVGGAQRRGLAKRRIMEALDDPVRNDGQFGAAQPDSAEQNDEGLSTDPYYESLVMNTGCHPASG